MSAAVPPGLSRAAPAVVVALFLFGLTGCREATVTGTVSIKGSEPHTWIALTTAEGKDYRLTGDLAVAIARRLQGAVVTVKVRPLGRNAAAAGKQRIPATPPELEVLRLVSPELPEGQDERSGRDGGSRGNGRRRGP